MKKSMILMIGFCLAAWTVRSQSTDSVYINLEKLLEVGGAQNLTIELYKRQQELAQADLAKAREWWLPEIYAGFQAHYLHGAAMNADGRFFLDVDRDNFWSGLGLNARWDFGEGIFQAKAAALRAEASRYETQAQQNQILLQTIHAYFDFLTAQLYNEAYQEMAAQADTIVDQLDIQVQSGIRFQSELLLAKSNRNHLKVQRLEARKDYLQQNARLVNLLNMQAKTQLVGVDTLLSPLELIPKAEWSQPSDSIFRNRPEYYQLQTGLEAVRTEKKSTTTGLLLPELRLDTYGSYFGSLSPAMSAERDPISRLYPTSELNVSLVWSVPIGRLTYRGRLKQYDARVALQENRLMQFQNQAYEEVAQARSQLLTANEQLALADEAQILAREAVQQSIQRQQLGTAEPFEVFQAQEFYLRARLDYLKAVADYNKAQYSLYVAIGNNL